LLALALEGWAQCRLATDPDPSDEPRGVSGWTFAVAGEPDFDRVLRLQPHGAVPRALSPPVGVFVTELHVDGQTVAGHVLHGAAVDLLDNPVFDGRNGLGAEDGLEPIVPFHLQVSGNGVTLARKHTDPATGQWVATTPVPGRVPQKVADRFGVGDAQGRKRYRAEREAQVRRALQQATTETQRVALGKRLAALAPTDAPTTPERILIAGATYDISLEGAEPVVQDESHALGGTITNGPWTVELKIGIFDADTLTAFVWGGVSIPFQPA
jgi:hypothetical protein